MTWEWLRDYVRQQVARAVRFTRVATTSASGFGDFVDGRKLAPTDPSYEHSVRRLWPFGLRSRPPAGVDAVVVHAFGGTTNGVMVGAESARYGPADLKVGEVALYNKAASCVIKLDENGAISITSTSTKNIAITATGTGEVVVNAGTAKVAVHGDATAGHTHAFGTLMCPNTGTGVPVAITGATASATDTINVVAARRFKG